MNTTAIQYPDYIVVDVYPHSKYFREHLNKCVELMSLDPSPTYEQMSAVFSDIPGMRVLSIQDQAHITARQWYEEIVHQLLAQFTTDFVTYGQRLQQLPQIERLLYSERRLVTNPVLVNSLRNAVSEFGLQLYFCMREQGLFEALERVEYILHHPAANSLMLYRGRDIHYTPDY